MNKNNKKAIKHYLCGAVSAFSVVAAYKAYKSIKDKKQNAVDKSNNCGNCGHYYGTSSNSLHTIKIERSKLNTPNSFQFGESGKGKAFRMDLEERILQPKHITYNKKYIEERKALTAPSGFVICSFNEKCYSFYKAEIKNVLKSTNDKIVIFNAFNAALPIMFDIDADYKDITKEELEEARKYDRCSIGEECAIAPLTERVTIFNADCYDDMETSLNYAFLKTSATSRSEHQHIWFFIPNVPSINFSYELNKIMRRSRMLGVIVTATAVPDHLIFNDDIRNMTLAHEFIAITDDIEKYNESYHIDLSKYIGTNYYQFDMERTNEKFRNYKNARNNK